MELISDNSSPSFNRRFATLWLGSVLFFAWISDYNWMILGLFLFGLAGCSYYWIKVKDIYYCGESIKIKDGAEFLEISIDNVVDVDSNPNLYRINFLDKTEFGYHIRFTPRTEGKLFKVKQHKALAEFVRKVNSNS